MNTIGDRLRHYIKFQEYKIKDFALIAKIGVATLNNYLFDRMVPGGDALINFYRLGININWLLTGEGEMLTNQAITEHKLLCPHCNNPIKITIEKG